MPTLSDIAEALGLNKTTVSKALNNSNDISRQTREKVFAQAEKMGYTKHRRKNVSRNELIGVICPEVTSYYYAQMVTCLSVRLQEKGYSALIQISDFSPEAEKRQFAKLVDMNVAGIVIITEQTNMSPMIHATPGAERIPVVIMGLNYESGDHDVVSIDERRGMRAIVEHLMERGHTRIAFLGDQLVNNRLAFLRQSLDGAGLSLPDEYVVLLDKRNEACGLEGARILMALREPPTAIVAGYDTIALGAYRALSEAGVRVPEDVALVGYDDSDFCRYLPCALTSVNCDVAAECRVAAAILVGHIKDPFAQSVQTAAIVPSLTPRESSAARR